MQKIGLHYYEDTNKRIPREEIDEYKKMFDKEFKKLANADSNMKLLVVIVGKELRVILM